MSEFPEKHATLVGYHGKQNIGDDIFFSMACHWLKSRNVKRCYVRGEREYIPQECNGVDIHVFNNPIKRIKRMQWLSIFLYARKSDYLIFAAGSIYTIQPFFLMYLTMLLLRAMKGSSFKSIAIGVSAGPFHSKWDQYWCAKVFSLMDKILLRDEKSLKLMDQYRKPNNITVSHDLALPYLSNYNEGSIKKVDRESIVIGVSITKRGFGDCGLNDSNACKVLSDVLKNKLSDNEEIYLRIISVCSDPEDGDSELSKDLIARLNKFANRTELHEYDCKNLSSTIFAIQSCNLMISYRMHAGIIAIFNAVPLLQYSYSEKIKSFYENNDLDKRFLCDGGEISKNILDSFISDSISGNLTDFSIKQRNKVMNNAHIMKEHLSSI